MHSFDHDKELDLLTKTAAEAIDAPSAANWDKMQRILDKELPQQKKRRGGIIWWIAPSILALGLGLYWLQSTQKQSLPKGTVQKETIQNSIVKQSNIEPATSTIDKETIHNLETSPRYIHSNHDKKIIIATPPLNTQDQSNSTKSNIKIEPTKEIVIAQTEVNTNNSNNSTNNNNNKVNTNNSTSSTNSTTINPVVESKVDSNNNVAPNNNFTNKSISVTTKKGFFVGVIGGFDVSTVKFNYATNVGYNFGGTLGYRFNNHWSVQTGAIYTQKNYKLKGQDFHPPKGSWISYYEIETVDGYCKMWDIPIIATYHFTGNNKGNSFVSIGSSSYFMKNENYNYLYYYNNQYYNRNNNYNSTDQHLFALLHISAGIERPIGKNITSIIEPYAKIPLTGVGFGSIQLSSFGLNFSVQYKQPKK
jgi:cytoskeletal protein RodZ